MLLILIMLVALLATLMNLWFYLGPLARLLSHSGESSSHAPQKTWLDILLAARNEEANLKKFLPEILSQEGKRLGVIVVNDNSTDGSGELLQSLAKKHSQLAVVSAFAKTTPGKKAALTQAIATSSADWILATDADCKPASSEWAHRMRSAIDSKTEIVLGYSPYQKQAGWLNRWIRFETLYTAAQYLSASLSGRPYMGVGRNMLYSRELFERLEGFSSHAHLAGGDDDLLVNQGASSTNTSICIDAEAWVYSIPNTSWKDYFRQKTRHLSVSTTYKKGDQLWLGLLAGSHIAHFIGVFALLYIGYWQEALLIYSVRLVIVWWRMGSTAKKLGERDLVPFLPLLDFGVLVYYLRFSIAAVFPKSGKKTW